MNDAKPLGDEEERAVRAKASDDVYVTTQEVVGLLATLDAARARCAEVEKQQTCWHAFGALVWRWLADHYEGMYDSDDAWQLAQLAVEAGLAERTKYDPAIHGESDCDPGADFIWPIKGDPAFVSVAALTAERDALRDEINGPGGWRELCRGHERVIGTLTAERDEWHSAALDYTDLSAKLQAVNAERDFLREQLDVAGYTKKLDALREQVRVLREALRDTTAASFRLLVACLRADAIEELPGEVDGGDMQGVRDVLRSCPDCDGMGTRDKLPHEDEVLEDDNICPRCEGWGILPEHRALAATEGDHD